MGKGRGSSRKCLPYGRSAAKSHWISGGGLWGVLQKSVWVHGRTAVGPQEVPSFVSKEGRPVQVPVRCEAEWRATPAILAESEQRGRARRGVTSFGPRFECGEAVSGGWFLPFTICY